MYKDYLFSKNVLVREGKEDVSLEENFAALYAIANKYNIRVRKGDRLATLEVLKYLESQIPGKVTLPFYRGFPESVKKLSPTELLFDQLFHYWQTYGQDNFEGDAGHSLFEENFTRTAFKEATTIKEFVIVDTAGRLAIDEAMMVEITEIKAAVNPSETLFVVDSMTGQDAVNTAKEFNDRLDFTGVILTKLDGDTRGGAALSIRTVVTKPIKFIGTGEKMEAIDQFHPNRMADRILGMGDVVSLVERAQEQFDEEEARKLQRKLARNQFDFNDFLTQIEQIKKMGNIKDLMAMIPGVGKAVKDLDIDDNAFKGVEAIIRSMTPKERANPDIINNSRKERIARGSGTTMQEVNRLMKQFEQIRKTMKTVAGGKFGNMMGGMMPRMKR
mgnify:CR=1 FL=1